MAASSLLVLVYLGGMLLPVIGVAAIALALFGERAPARWVGIATVAVAVGSASATRRR